MFIGNKGEKSLLWNTLVTIAHHQYQRTTTPLILKKVSTCGNQLASYIQALAHGVSQLASPATANPCHCCWRMILAEDPVIMRPSKH